MKHVHTNAMVCHLWANQSQESARNRQGNLFFEGDCIYSYRRSFKIGEIVIAPNGHKFYFINNNNFSRTTGKHINELHNSLPDDGIRVEVDMQSEFFGYCYFNTANAHKSIDYVSNEINDALNKQTRAIKYSREFARAHRLYQIYISLCRGWGKEYTAISKFPSYDKAAQSAEMSQKRAEQESIKKAQKEHHNLEKWVKHEYNGYLYHSPIHLRLSPNGNEIQTSRGATVPLDAAMSLWDAITQKQEIKGKKIGSFTCIANDGETIKIGCHNIPMGIAAQFMEKLTVNQ